VVYGLSIGTKIGDVEWRNGHYFALFAEFGSFRGQLHKSGRLAVNRFSPKKRHIVPQLSTMDALCSLR